MRPRPATRAALLVDHPETLARCRSSDVRSRNRIHEERPFLVARCRACLKAEASFELCRDRARLTAKSTVRRTLKRPQRPGNPSPRRSASSETLRQFTLENYRLPSPSCNPWPNFRTSHVCAFGTFRQECFVSNRKPGWCCAEAVEDESSLWKVKENRRKRGCGCARHGRGRHMTEGKKGWARLLAPNLVWLLDRFSPALHP